MDTYVTFGFDHKHEVNGVELDNDTVAVITSNSAQEGRSIAFKLFGTKFCMEYPEQHWDESKMHFFPKGKVRVN